MYLTSHCSGTRDPAHREAQIPKGIGRIGRICKKNIVLPAWRRKKRKRRERFEGKYHYCSLQVKHGRTHFKMYLSWPRLNTNRFVTISQTRLMHSLRKKSCSKGLLVMSSTRCQIQQQRSNSEENALEKNT